MWGWLTWIASFFRPRQLLLKESPESYLDRVLSSVKGKNILYYNEGSLYYEVHPFAYTKKYYVKHDMSAVTIDNSIAEIKLLFYKDDEPQWPRFIKNDHPDVYWTDPLMIFMEEVLG